jgi:hypothetical protein
LNGCIKIRVNIIPFFTSSSSFLTMAAWRGCVVEQPTVRLAAMKAAEEAMDFRVGGGGHAGAGEEVAIRQT